MKNLKTLKFKLSPLDKENNLNKILKSQKITKKKLYLLFVSLWDNYSSDILESLNNKYSDDEGKYPLYIIDSYNMPHAFVIYNTVKVPQLVVLDGNKVLKEDYLPKVYKYLGL